ncbi:MAG: threonine-phosphate decarboxylase [Roseobacter sp.]
MKASQRDHGGGIDAATTRYGGTRIDWIDLSTGINPQPYPIPAFPAGTWTQLPDSAAMNALITAARHFWKVPEDIDILASSGASALIAQIPTLHATGEVVIPAPTYNEHAASFDANGWQQSSHNPNAQVIVHPNNPDGRLWTPASLPAPEAQLTVIDESFCDVSPEKSLMPLAGRPGTLILKSFGKFWGLAGLRLGFVIGDPTLLSHLRERLGPWSVSGPALHIGAAALSDEKWATSTRLRLVEDSKRLDGLMQTAGAECLGGTTLFRLYNVSSGSDWQTRLAQHHIWTRTFPYNKQWLRLGLPTGEGWPRLERALTE